MRGMNGMRMKGTKGDRKGAGKKVREAGTKLKLS